MDNNGLDFGSERIPIELFTRVPIIEWVTFKTLLFDTTQAKLNDHKKWQISKSQLILSSGVRVMIPKYVFLHLNLSIWTSLGKIFSGLDSSLLYVNIWFCHHTDMPYLVCCYVWPIWMKCQLAARMFTFTFQSLHVTDKPIFFECIILASYDTTITSF